MTSISLRTVAFGFGIVLGVLTLCGIAAEARRAKLETIEVVVKHGDIFQGVRFPVGSKITLAKEGGTVVTALLSQDLSISGHLILRGTSLQIWDDGNLFEISTQAGQRIGDLVFKEHEAGIRFNRKGELEGVSLKNRKVIQGLELTGHVELTAKGQVLRGTLATDQSLSGLNLKGGTQIRLFSSGQIQQAKLARASKVGPFVIEGDPNPANPGETEFWANGRVKEARLKESLEIDGFTCGAGPISIFESGKLKECFIAKARTILLHPYPDQGAVKIDAQPGDRLNLNEAGTVIGRGTSIRR